ncbi:MAG: Flavoredoxin [Microgenomates bacterium OLB23]|nr:MAG: Flavoredoxin [Microgenomates bacterium OLB23]
MEITPTSELAKGFTTTVGIIGSKGLNGDNLMAAEWTYLLSYKPAIISVHIGNYRSKATAENIGETKMFSVSLAAAHHNVLSSLIGNSTGHTVNKIAALQELGYRLERSTTTGLIYVPDAVFIAECTLINSENFGDHTMFVGKVVAAQEGTSTNPLLYNRKKYWNLGEPVVKPSDEERTHFADVFPKYKK